SAHRRAGAGPVAGKRAATGRLPARGRYQRHRTPRGQCRGAHRGQDRNRRTCQRSLARLVHRVRAVSIAGPQDCFCRARRKWSLGRHGRRACGRRSRECRGATRTSSTMSLFAEIEKTIERGFRRWTEKVFGPGESDELLVLHHAVLQTVDSKIQTLKRGGRIFPYAGVVTTFHAADPQRRQLLQAAFGERLEAGVREALASAGCTLPRGFKVEVRTAESGSGPFQIEFPAEAPASSVAADQPARLETVQGKTAHDSYTLEKARTNIGRMAE